MSCEELDQFYELPPNDKDTNKQLDEIFGVDENNNEHIYYVYYKKTLHGIDDTIMSIGDDSFFDIDHQDSPEVKASKNYFIREKERHESFNRMYFLNAPLALGELEENRVQEFNSNNNDPPAKRKTPNPNSISPLLRENIEILESKIKSRRFRNL